MNEGKHQFVIVTVAATASSGAARAHATGVLPAMNATATATIHGVASWQAKRLGGGLAGMVGPSTRGRTTPS